MRRSQCLLKFLCEKICRLWKCLELSRFYSLLFLSVSSVERFRRVFDSNRVLGSALRCWTCTSLLDFCDDPFKGNSSLEFHSHALKTCEKPMYSSLRSSDEPVCLKTRIFYANSNRTVTHRMCDWNGDKESGASCRNKNVGSDGVIEFCGACFSDDCNGGKSVQAISFVVLTSLCLNIFWRFLLE